MPLGNRAEDMGVALQRLAAGDRVENQAAWDALRRESSAEFLSEFHARFYLEREALRRHDLDAWLALTPTLLSICRFAPPTSRRLHPGSGYGQRPPLCRITPGRVFDFKLCFRMRVYRGQGSWPFKAGPSGSLAAASGCRLLRT